MGHTANRRGKWNDAEGPDPGGGTRAVITRWQGRDTWDPGRKPPPQIPLHGSLPTSPPTPLVPCLLRLWTSAEIFPYPRALGRHKSPSTALKLLSKALSDKGPQSYQPPSSSRQSPPPCRVRERLPLTQLLSPSPTEAPTVDPDGHGPHPPQLHGRRPRGPSSVVSFHQEQPPWLALC